MAEVTSQPTQRFLDFRSGKSTFLNFIPIPSVTLGQHRAFPKCPSTHYPSLGENRRCSSPSPRHWPLLGCEIPSGPSHSPPPPYPVLPPSTLKTVKLSMSLELLCVTSTWDIHMATEKSTLIQGYAVTTVGI